MTIILVAMALMFTNYPRLPAAQYDGSQLIVGGRWNTATPQTEIGPVCLDIQDHVEPIVRFDVQGKYSFADTLVEGYAVEAMAVREYQDSEQAIFRVYINVLPPCRVSWNRTYYLQTVGPTWSQLKATYR